MMKKLVQYWRDLSLVHQLAYFTSLLVVLVVLALTIVSGQRERKTFQQELENQANLILDTLPLTMRDQLYRLEIDELRDIANVVSDNDHVTLVQIFNHEGTLLVDAAFADPIFSTELDELGKSLIELEPDQVNMEWQNEAGQLLAGRAVWLGNQPIGAFAVGLSTAPLQAKLSAQTIQTLIIAASALAIGIALSFVFARQIITPLRALTLVATKMAGGERETRVDIVSENEVGNLGKSFNTMAEAIQKRETDLSTLTASLEQTVEERTTELRENIQKLVQANADLEVARRQAEEATQLKSQFLASMSHELRTPLNAIMGFSQLLLAGTSGQLTDPQAEKVDRVFKNAQTLLDLINDLLDLAKIESGRSELIEKPIVLEEWLAGIKSQLEPLASKKDLTFSANVDSTLPEVISGDPTRLKQIAINLLSNAFKFTNEGTVTLDLKKQSDSQWMLVVTDTGIGIPSHAQEFIFDEFRQVDGSSRRKYGGTGLGLAIVRNLVLMMGGTVRVSSEVGKGSTFTVHLPLKEAQVPEK
jgi:signal transduction histidine kinase